MIRAVDLLGRGLVSGGDTELLPSELPEIGRGAATLDLLAPIVSCSRSNWKSGSTCSSGQKVARQFFDSTLENRRVTYTASQNERALHARDGVTGTIARYRRRLASLAEHGG